MLSSKLKWQERFNFEKIRYTIKTKKITETVFEKDLFGNDVEVEKIVNTRVVEQSSVATFSQSPLKVAYAITIHKSQRKTFNKVIIDMGFGAFAKGQLYTALSRCRTLEGIILKRPIKREDFL